MPTSSASFLPECLRSAPGARLFAERDLQAAFDETALGQVHRRSAGGDADGDVFVADTSVDRQENMCPLELARGMLSDTS